MCSVSQRTAKGSPTLIPTPWAEEDEGEEKKRPDEQPGKRPQRDLAEKDAEWPRRPEHGGSVLSVVFCLP